MTIKEAIQEAKIKLNKEKIDEAGLIAKILLAHVLVCKKEELTIKNDKKLEKIQEDRYFQNIEKISKRLPSSIYNGV